MSDVVPQNNAISSSPITREYVQAVEGLPLSQQSSIASSMGRVQPQMKNVTFGTRAQQIEAEKSKLKIKKIEIQESNVPSNIIIIVTIFIIVVFWAILLYYAIGINTGAVPPNQQNFALSTGLCAANVVSGEKVCLTDDDDSLNYDPNVQVVTSAGGCDNPTFPYALLPNDGISTIGRCADDPITGEPSQCRCLNTQQCPEYITSYFRTVSGNAFASLDVTRTSFDQVTGQSPIQIDEPTRQFCTIPISWLYRSTPGCNFVTPSQVDTPDGELTTVNTCMRLPVNNVGNPCASGILAFITDSPDDMTLNNIGSIPIGCVRGSGSPPDEDSVTVWDEKYGGIVYINLRQPPLTCPN